MKAEKTIARPARLNLNLSEQARVELDRLAAKANTTFTDIVRTGLMLARVYYELLPDERLAVVKVDGTLVAKILPPVGM